MTYYAFNIFLSAFLLFQIQPMIGKYILPWFGGSSSVWTTSILFFQVVLLGGYAYAYWLADRLTSRRQGVVHLALLTVSIILLLATGLSWDSPITPGAPWRPENTNSPVIHIFIILGISVGLPYFILSSNSILMQTWFNQACPGRSPYRLYALSNAGSLLALISYPILLEPSLALKTQANFWSWSYAAFAISTGYGAIKAMRMKVAPIVRGSSSSVQHNSDEEMRPGIGTCILWAALTTCASVMLLATTNQITQEVASIPFLWVVPLTLYLLSFILCFSSDRWYTRRAYFPALFIGSTLFYWVMAKGMELNFLLQITVYSTVMFICCMICHGELVRLKPHPRYLPSFYLLIATGGAMGGIFVALVAPLIFTGFWELPLGVLAHLPQL